MDRKALVAGVIALPLVLAKCERAAPPTYAPVIYPAIPSASAAASPSSPPEPAPPPFTPSLVDYAAFEFFADSGTFEVYSDLGGRLLKREDDRTSFRDGGVRFLQVGPTRGIISGNAGADDIEVQRTDRIVSFIERNAFHLHVLTIEDRWLPDRRGFAATYSRNINNPLRQERMVSLYSGIAVPPGRREPAK